MKFFNFSKIFQIQQTFKMYHMATVGDSILPVSLSTSLSLHRSLSPSLPISLSTSLSCSIPVSLSTRLYFSTSLSFHHFLSTRLSLSIPVSLSTSFSLPVSLYQSPSLPVSSSLSRLHPSIFGHWSQNGRWAPLARRVPAWPGADQLWGPCPGPLLNQRGLSAPLRSHQ